VVAVVLLISPQEYIIMETAEVRAGFWLADVGQ
jgi:hypothetical protein